MVVSQVTNMQTFPDPTFLEPYNCNKSSIDSSTPLCFFFFWSLPSVETMMAVHGSVMKEDDMLCELYADTYSDV